MKGGVRMPRPFRAGFIGCGSIAKVKHLPVLAEDGRIAPVALYDINRGAAEGCKGQFQLDADVVDEAAAILRRDDIDIVYVLTPNATHAVLAIEALNCGKHVVCEKPMALTRADADKMLAAARENRRVLHISFQNRYTDQALTLKRLISEGMFSPVYHAKAYAIRRRAEPTWGVFLDKALQGGGPLIDIGSHAIDLALWLAGNFEPSYLSCGAYRHIAERGSEANRNGNWDPARMKMEDSAFGFVVMQNGMTLSVDAAWALNTESELEASVDVFGAGAGAHLRANKGLSIVREMGGQMFTEMPCDSGAPRTMSPPTSASSPARREYEDYLGRILSGDVQNQAASEAAAVTGIIEGLYESARTLRPFVFGN